MKCRAEAAIEICGCRPFFYIFVEGIDCNAADLACLTNQLWPQLYSKTCYCPKTCTDINYSVDTFQKTTW